MAVDIVKKMLEKAKAEGTEAKKPEVAEATTECTTSPSGKKMGRPGRIESSANTTYIRCKVTMEELAALKKQCIMSGITMDELIYNGIKQYLTI